MYQRLKGGQFYGEQIRQRAFSGLVLNETRYSPCSFVPRHCHEHAYLCLIRHGTYREEYGDSQRLCGPSMLAFHPAGEVHAEHFDQDEVRSFNMEISSSWLSRLSDQVQVEQPFAVKGGPLASLMLRVLDEFEQPDVSSSIIIEGLTLELLGLGMRERRRDPNIPHWLRRTRDYLTANCTASLNLTMLAAEAGVQPTYLASAFHRHYGCTVGTYIRRERVGLACRQLSNSDTRLAEIAFNTGFADQSHFTRIFKSQTGLTPSAYRKMTARGANRPKN